MTLLYLIPLALLIGLVRGGSLRHYAAHPLRGLALPCLAFLSEALLIYLPALTGWPKDACLYAAVPLEYALLILFCALNFRRAGVKWMLLGILLNFLAIAANGMRMPVSELVLALESTRATAARIQSGELFEYVIVGAGAPLYFLGDIIYLPFLPGTLGSFGDWILGIGAARLLVGLMRPEQRKEFPSG